MGIPARSHTATPDVCSPTTALGTREQAQSSRSHAIMRLEVVNEAVLTARAALDVAKSLSRARKYLSHPANRRLLI